MGSIGCRCGEDIPDYYDGMPHKANIIPAQQADYIYIPKDGNLNAHAKVYGACARLIYQCPSCGRLLVQSPDRKNWYSFKPEESGNLQLLGATLFTNGGQEVTKILEYERKRKRER